MIKQNELLDLASRFREFARQTTLDHYAAQMLNTAAELEARALSQRNNREDYEIRVA